MHAKWSNGKGAKEKERERRGGLSYRSTPSDSVLLRDAFKLFMNSSALSSCTRPFNSTCNRHMSVKQHTNKVQAIPGLHSTSATPNLSIHRQENWGIIFINA